MTHIIDNTSKASIPGQLNISKRKYLDYIGLKGVNRLKYYLLFCLPYSILFKLFQRNIIVFDFIQKTEQFKYGCLNPTIVINKDEGLIGTFTNLTSYGEEITPVIKISKEPLELIRKQEVNNGQKLASVALYARDEDDEFASAWIDFDPKVANCFTDDIEACNHLLFKLNENAWKCLEVGLNQINNTEELGLYYLEMETELVRKSYS